MSGADDESQDTEEVTSTTTSQCEGYSKDQKANLQEVLEKIIILRLAECNLLREMHSFDEAEKGYEEIHNDDALPHCLSMAALASSSASTQSGATKFKRETQKVRFILTKEKWVKPYALYEHGVLKFLKVKSLQSETQNITQNSPDVKTASDIQEITSTTTSTTRTSSGHQPPTTAELDLLKSEGKLLFQSVKKLFGGIDYSFEMQMAFRLHLTHDMVLNEESSNVSMAQTTSGS